MAQNTGSLWMGHTLADQSSALAVLLCLLGMLGIASASAATISANGNHVCAVTNEATVACWGKNLNGQLGDGTTKDQTTAVAVVGLTGVTSVAAGYRHSCALKNNGTVACWGANKAGQASRSEE